MKLFLFLILLLPFVNALAVVPSHLEIEDYGELKIINTRDEEVRFRISGAYEDEFVLGALESKKIIVEEEGIVTIEEIYNEKLVNAVSVEVEKEGSNYFGLSLSSALLSLLIGGVYSWKKIRKRKA
ncbi:hypothetical protein J4223_01615 [Candidatus Woesearchaeota archaeon]|nr:hypothetical protein [Candidatus Woesearchaeota archaeon]